MKNQDFKNNVLSAMDSLDFEEVNQVLRFIHTIKNKSIPDKGSQFRQDAMNQIREALRTEQSEPIMKVSVISAI